MSTRTLSRYLPLIIAVIIYFLIRQYEVINWIYTGLLVSLIIFSFISDPVNYLRSISFRLLALISFVLTIFSSIILDQNLAIAMFVIGLAGFLFGLVFYRIKSPVFGFVVGLAYPFVAYINYAADGSLENFIPIAFGLHFIVWVNQSFK